MLYKGPLNTFSKSIFFALQYIPQMIQDSASLMKHFYQNSPTISSRATGVFLKAVAESLFLQGNELSKDGNPVSSSVIREGLNVLPITYNVIIGTQHVSGKPEILEGFYWAGQFSRFTCKLTPQLLLGTDVKVSRLSNIGCDAFAIMGNDLSKMSQADPSKKIYWFWHNQDDSVEHIWAISFVREKATPDFLRKSFITAGVKSIILDQIGEVIKLFKASSFIINSCKYIEALENNLSSKFYIPLKNGLEKIFAIANKALPDLFIEGPMMLSVSNDIAKLYKEASTKDEAIIVVTATIATIFKKDLFLLAAKAAPELMPIGLILLASDEDYNKVKNIISSDMAYVSETIGNIGNFTINFFAGQGNFKHDET